MLFCFFYFSLSRLIEFQKPVKVSTLLSFAKFGPLFVTYYRKTCRFSQDFLPKFEKASTFFPKIIFAEVDCDEETDICDILSIVGTPTTFLYTQPNLSAAREFTFPRTVHSIVDFLESNSRCDAINTTKSLAIASPLTLSKYINYNGCSVVLFRSYDNPSVHKYWKNLRLMGAAFENEDISFSSINCITYEVCHHYVKYLPSFQIYKNGTLLHNITTGKSNDILADINEYCGFHRKLNGLLEEDFVLTEDIKKNINMTLAKHQNNETFSHEDSPITEYNGFIEKIIQNMFQKEDKITYIQTLIFNIDKRISQREVSLDCIDRLAARRYMLAYIRSLIY